MQNNNLHMQHNVLCIPLLFLHNYDVKMHNETMNNATMKFLFSS